MTVRKAAREQLRGGADLLELAMTGSLLVQDDVPVAKQLVADEFSAAVDEATKAGKRVAAHAHGIEGIRQAVLAGATTIEHATFLHKGRDVIDEMVKRGTFMVPTLNAGRVIAEGGTSRVPAWMVERLNDTYESARKSTRLAHQAGVARGHGQQRRHAAQSARRERAGNPEHPAGRPQAHGSTRVRNPHGRPRCWDAMRSWAPFRKASWPICSCWIPIHSRILSRLADKKQLRAVFLDGKLVARQATDAYPRTVLGRDCLLIGQ